METAGGVGVGFGGTGVGDGGTGVGVVVTVGAGVGVGGARVGDGGTGVGDGGKSRANVTAVGPSKTLENAPFAKAKSCRTSIIFMVLSAVPEYVKLIVHIISSVIALAGEENEK